MTQHKGLNIGTVTTDGSVSRACELCQAPTFPVSHPALAVPQKSEVFSTSPSTFRPALFSQPWQSLFPRRSCTSQSPVSHREVPSIALGGSIPCTDVTQTHCDPNLQQLHTQSQPEIKLGFPQLIPAEGKAATQVFSSQH